MRVVEKKENEDKIKAIGTNQAGDAKLFKEVYYERGNLGPRDLLVKVFAVSINPVDYKKRKFAFLESKPLSDKNPMVMGYDASAEVIAVGSQVEFFKVGDLVYYSGDVSRKGANGTEHIVDERIVGFKPKNLTHPDAGAGGVGSAAIQLAKRILGLHVVATASRTDTVDFCTKMGADLVINHRNPLAEELQKHDIKEVDYILNCYDMTPEYFKQIAHLIKPFGEVCGIAGFEYPLELQLLFNKAVRISMVFMGGRPVYKVDMETQHKYFKQFTQWFEEKTLVPTLTICEDFNVENLIKAHEKVESGTMIGKYVLHNVDKF
eukprot:CAMPEP_0176405266 /NCGR_PEP_ID=MMETSP0127-20121128/243_1 /TAXON_ID=938130 /ORGANISM="Platyophrya macrostoma, Strain WH" /LENGTH=319 /DNA_ID=CAMNT_0017784307 /DNA_START=54 /DNA_END=1013 /DNA_ORIENTATION=-